MKLVAAAAVTVAVAFLCAGCGFSGQLSGTGQTITFNLPAARSADDVTGQAVVGHLANQTRRVNARSAGASRAPAAVLRPTTAAITPLTPAADARLNGVSVWVPYWGLGTAVSDAVANASVIKVAHPFIDEITGSSTVVDQSGGAAAQVSAELAAGHIDVIPTVTETAPMNEFAATHANPKRQAALLKSLVGIAGEPGNSGIDLDFEDMAYGNGNAGNAETIASRYPELLARLCAVLHRENRSCEVTVMAKNDGGLHDADGLDTSVYDYRALGQVADRVQIMAYDDHVPSGAAGPVAPWPWVESVVNYAITQIPAEKIVLGVPAYGYDWSSAGGGTSLTATAARALASDVHAQVRWDATDVESFFDYATDTITTKVKLKTVTRMGTAPNGTPVKHTLKLRIVTKVRHTVQHTVWFEDSTADYDRAVLAADDKLAGIAVWAGGDESPGLWAMLAHLK